MRMPRSPFIGSNGAIIVPRIHTASFDRPQNWSKGKAFILLYSRKRSPGLSSGLNYKEIARLIGVSSEYLRKRLRLWVEWRYLSRRLVREKSGRSMYHYSIAQRGVEFTERIPSEVYEQMAQEIIAWQKQRSSSPL